MLLKSASIDVLREHVAGITLARDLHEGEVPRPESILDPQVGRR